jgi:hypothetical protein
VASAVQQPTRHQARDASPHDHDRPAGSLRRPRQAVTQQAKQGSDGRILGRQQGGGHPVPRDSSAVNLRQLCGTHPEAASDTLQAQQLDQIFGVVGYVQERTTRWTTTRPTSTRPAAGEALELLDTSRKHLQGP